MKSVLAYSSTIIAVIAMILTAAPDIADFGHSEVEKLVVDGEVRRDGPNVVVDVRDSDGQLYQVVLHHTDVGRVAMALSKPSTPDSIVHAGTTPATEGETRRPALGVVTSAIDGSEYKLAATSQLVTIERGSESFEFGGDIALKLASMFNVQRGRNPESGSEVFLDVANNTGWYSLGGGFKLSSVAIVIGLLMLLVAGLTALAVILRLRRQRAYLVKMQKQAIKAREEERRLLAAELHDGPVQELQYLVRSVTKEGALQHREDEVHHMLDTVSGTLRKICHELRPPILTHFGLESAMRWFTDEFERRNSELNITLSLDCNGKLLSSEQELAYFRIMQESLNNIGKHANASEVAVDLSIENGWAELLITDNGDGFEVPRNFSKLAVEGHLGLLGITQRAEAIGAGIEFRSEPGKGTTVRVVTQLQSENPDRRRASVFMKA